MQHINGHKEQGNASVPASFCVGKGLVRFWQRFIILIDESLLENPRKTTQTLELRKRKRKNM